MKNLLTLLFCLCIIFSSFGFAENSKSQLAKNELNFISSKAVAENEFPNIFRPIGNWFKRIFRRNKRIIEYPFPWIENLTLSRTEVAATCSINNNSCSNNEPTTEISAEGRDWAGEEVIYKYQVSAGQIIGLGSKVVWDLSKVKPGTYTIIAGADDACGGCGKTVTKEVKVVECPNCN